MWKKKWINFLFIIKWERFKWRKKNNKKEKKVIGELGYLHARPVGSRVILKAVGGMDNKEVKERKTKKKWWSCRSSEWHYSQKNLSVEAECGSKHVEEKWNKGEKKTGRRRWKKGKAPGAGGGEPGTVDEDVSDGQSSVAVGTHRSRPAGHIVPVRLLRVSQTESS